MPAVTADPPRLQSLTDRIPIQRIEIGFRDQYRLCHNGSRPPAWRLPVPKGRTLQATSQDHFRHHSSNLSTGSGFRQAGHILERSRPEFIVSKRKLRQAETIQLVRANRESERQNLGFSSRPFVLCGLPVKRPAPGCLLHERRNGQFVLQVTGHPSYGLPWGQDRLVPIFLATLAIRQQTARITFASAAEMLDTFGLQQGGSQYRRLVASFQRIFGATIFFGTDTQREHAAVFHRARFNFMSEARIWYSRDPEQRLLPGDCQNLIVLSDEFYSEILNHPIPTDLEAAKALSSSPAALDLFMWLSYRCFTARRKECVPLFGDFGLISQLGSAEYARPRKFREKLESWLGLIRAMWHECPAWIDKNGTGLLVDRAYAVVPPSGTGVVTGRVSDTRRSAGRI
jgi:hypothetical protein